MRPSWSSSALMQGEDKEAEPLVSAASTPVDGNSLVRSFLCLIIRSFIHLFICSFLCSFIKHMCSPRVKYIQPELVYVWGPEGTQYQQGVAS